jgi:hypothetical protein
LSADLCAETYGLTRSLELGKDFMPLQGCSSGIDFHALPFQGQDRVAIYFSFFFQYRSYFLFNRCN